MQLDDSDAVLVLITPKLMDSEWVRDEVTLANTRRIGLLGVVWPADDGHDPSSAAVAHQLCPDQRIDLTRPARAYDAHEPLDAQELAAIDRTVFTGRAVAVAARIRDLVDQAPDALAPDFAVGDRLADGDLRLTRVEDDAPWVGRIVPFRPPILDLWRWREEVRKHAAEAAGLVVCYPTLEENDPRESPYREICDAWGSRTTPHVLLRGVHL
ncbi:MAG: TIR domain-containing protein [Kofleriaceae bacterium]